MHTRKFWNVNTGACEETYEGHDGGVCALQFDATTLVSGSVDKTVRVYNVETAACLEVLDAHVAYVAALEFCTYALATGSGDATIRMWDLRSGECHRVLDGHTGAVNSLQFDFDNHRMISASADATIKVWDLRKGACVATTQMAAPISAISALGPMLAAAPSDALVKVFPAYGTNPAAAPYEGHQQRVLSGHTGAVKAVQLAEAVRGTNGGTCLFSAGADSDIRIWAL